MSGLSGVRANWIVQIARPATRASARPVRAGHLCGAGARIASTSRRLVPVLRTPCGDAFGRDQEIAGLHGELTAIEQEQAVAFDHLVDLVLSGVRM